MEGPKLKFIRTNTPRCLTPCLLATGSEVISDKTSIIGFPKRLVEEPLILNVGF
jgi:hypothetical protein